MDLITLALAKSHVAKTADSLGSLKGAPCTISKIEETDDGSIVTYQWTGTSGAIETRTMTVKNGVGIQSIVRDNANNKVIYTMTDGTQHTVNDIEVEAVDVSYTNTEEPDIDNVKKALDKLFKNCTDTIGEDFSPDVSTGSVKDFYPANTTLADIIKDMLTVKDPPQLNLSINPNKTLYDIVSESVPSLTINATIVKKTNPIEKVEFYVNGALKHTVTSGVANGGTFPYVYNTEIKATTTIKVVVTDSEGLSATSTKKIEFCGSSYHGIVPPETSTVTEAMVKTLTKTLKNTNDFVYSNINCEYNKIIYAFPAEFGKLTMISDVKNNFSYLESFECKNITIDNIPYYAYLLIEAVGVDGAEITFK